MISLAMHLPLIEEGFFSFIIAGAPPPRWFDRGFHRRAPSAAVKHWKAWPPKKEKRAFI
jgi:hypothetical protein